jgi:hypothetical protein
MPFTRRKAGFLDSLVNVLPATGAEMDFAAFVAAARAAGANPQFWLKAKHAGLIETRIDDQGRHMVRRASNAQNGGA